MLKRALLACVLVVGLALPAAIAQLPAGKPPVKLVTPPGMKPVLKVVPPSELDALYAARIRLLADQWGLTVTRANFQPSFTVSPRAAGHANGASLIYFTSSRVPPEFTSTDRFPNGRIFLQEAVANPTDYAGIADVPATPKDWFLLECNVTGSYFEITTDGNPGPRGRNHLGLQGYREISSGGGPRIYALFPPSTAPRRTFTMRSIQIDIPSIWDFGGCEVLPIRP